MGQSKAQKLRKKQVREGRINPEMLRSTWQRKPQEQVVINKRAEQHRSYCRKQGDDGAVFLCSDPRLIMHSAIAEKSS